MVTEQQKIDEVVKLLSKSKSVFFITGAGISAESGLPTYRGLGGLYNGKLTDEGMPVEEALSGLTLERQPEITWKYLSEIERNCRKATFNRAHKIIVEAEEVFKRVWVFTQNIDGFHHAAGSKNIIDIHGNMHNLYCRDCGFKLTVKDYSNLEIPPHCQKCEGIMRPDVVFFGEYLPPEKLKILQRELSSGFDIYFSIGTTSVFPYIQQPMIYAKSKGKPTIEINPSDTEISSIVDIKISNTAVNALDNIWSKFLKTNK
ncbi:MAG: NAD-dependent deacylase [Candidatus Omnitrophica bacterium]|nr:NAD-dependent deacylase [Candidatus Omnitrophota bacterium]